MGRARTRRRREAHDQRAKRRRRHLRVAILSDVVVASLVVVELVGERAVRVGALALIMPPLLGRIRTEAPQLRLVIRPADVASLEVDIREARIDLAITIPQFTRSGLHSLRLFDERYVGVARAGHPLLAGGAVSVDAFCDHPHLLVSPCRGDAAGPTDEALAAIGRSRRIGLVVPGFSVVGALLEQTDLIAVLPERMIGAMRRDIETFEPPVRVAGFRLNAYWPPRLDVSPPHRWLRNEIARAAKTCNVFLENRPAVPPAA